MFNQMSLFFPTANSGNTEDNNNANNVPMDNSNHIITKNDSLDEISLNDVPLENKMDSKNVQISSNYDAQYCFICGNNKSTSTDKCLTIRPCCQLLTVHETCFNTLMKNNNNHCSVCDNDLSPIITQRTIRKCAWDNCRFYCFITILVLISIVCFYYTYISNSISSHDKNVIRIISVISPVFIFFKYTKSSLHGSSYWNFSTRKSSYFNSCGCSPNEKTGWMILGKDNFYYYNSKVTNEEVSEYGKWRLYENIETSQCIINICNWIIPSVIYTALSCLMVYSYVKNFHINLVRILYFYGMIMGLAISYLSTFLFFIIPQIRFMCAYIKKIIESMFCHTLTIPTVNSDCIVDNNMQLYSKI